TVVAERRNECVFVRGRRQKAVAFCVSRAKVTQKHEKFRRNSEKVQKEAFGKYYLSSSINGRNVLTCIIHTRSYCKA
ncbi:MAG: hypothetical protein ACI3YC_03875, partial [Alloprevotella sp.]